MNEQRLLDLQASAAYLGGQIVVLISSTLLSSILGAAIYYHFAPAPIPTGTTHTGKATLYGWAFPPNTESTFRDPDTGQPFAYRTNSQGWKDVEHAFKRDHRKRILVIGDSFTWGYVPIAQQYTRVLERLAGYEVISVAMCGWGTDQELAAYRNEGRRYHPDLVVLQFCLNDIDDVTFPRSWSPRWNYRQKKPFRFGIEQDGWKIFPQLVEQFRDTVKQDHARFVVFDVGIGNSWHLDYDPHKTVLDICSKHGIAMIESRLVYRRFQHDPHTNAEGNRQMAEDIAAFLR